MELEARVLFVTCGITSLGLSKALYRSFGAPLGIYGAVWSPSSLLYSPKLFPRPDLHLRTVGTIVISWARFTSACVLRATPQAVGTDRGMSTRQNEAALRAMGIDHVALPARGGWAGRLFVRRRVFRRLLRWRSGQEGRITHLQHAFQLDRSRYRGAKRAATSSVEGIFAHNLTRAARRLLSLAPEGA